MNGFWHRVPRRGWLALAGWILLNAVVAWLVIFGIRLEHHIPPEDLVLDEGHCYRARLPERRLFLNPSEEERADSLLLEDGEPLGPAKSRRRKIVRSGMGKYRHADGRILLSTFDNSDPRTNGRQYSLISQARLPYTALALSAFLPFLPYGLRRLTWNPALKRLRERRFRSRRQIRTVVAVLVGLNALIAWWVVIGIEVEYPIPPDQIAFKEGHSYEYRLPNRLLRVRTDSQLDKRRAESALREDGKPIGPAHGNHRSIISIGMGKYSHWDSTLYFSTSDNSDPRTNGRHYSLISRGRLPSDFLILSVLPLLPFLFFGLYRWTATRFPQRGPSTTEGGTTATRYLLRGLVWATVAATGAAISTHSSHVIFWLGATLTAIGTVYVAANLFHTALALLGRVSRLGASHPLAFTLLSIGVFAMLFEGTLGYLESTANKRVKKAKAQATAAKPNPTTATTANHEQAPVPLLHPQAATMKASRRGVLTLPEAWKKRPVEIPGSIRSYYWHEVLHVHDQHSFRRATPLPPKTEGVFRIMVIGDSITYGEGVDVRWIYPTLIEEQLAKDFSVEVLNLGASGRQSEDILLILKRFLPELSPNLVLYGVCHNDFLPSGIGQYTKKYPFPMPESWKEFFLGRTRVAHFVDGAYDVIARALGLRADFFDDILRDFDGYQERFGRDVKTMNDFVLAQGLPPIVTMVFDQVPNVARTSYQVTQHAERLLKAAGMTVIETEDYYRRFEGRNLRVSQWEGHPDEEAHAIFAGMFLDRIRSLVDLEPYRRTP